MLPRQQTYNFVYGSVHIPFAVEMPSILPLLAGIGRSSDSNTLVANTYNASPPGQAFLTSALSSSPIYDNSAPARECLVGCIHQDVSCKSVTMTFSPWPPHSTHDLASLQHPSRLQLQAQISGTIPKATYGNLQSS